jgi:hypothetical protein
MADVIDAFKKIDEELCRRSKKMKVKILGGASILLLGMRDRVTADIDVAATGDAAEFQKMCIEMGITVDIITISSTVDLGHCAAVNVFNGKSLEVDSVTPKDLLKLKLERFYKQDPEDIYAIIKHESISFEEFRSIVLDMLPYYIGNVRQLIISAQIVVEQIWPSNAAEFKNDPEFIS